MTTVETPEELEVYLGSFAAASYGVWWRDDHLVYESFGDGYADRAELRITPSAAQWRRFWRTVDELGVWDWDTRYHPAESLEAPPAVRDGTHWSLTLRHAGRTAQSSGDSAGPGAADLDESRAFTAFVAALSRLIGGRAFG